jgi:hypothetical protein
MNNEKNTCSHCRFWDGNIYREEFDIPAYGYCKRYPPVPVTQGKISGIPENLDLMEPQRASFFLDWRTRTMPIFGLPVTEINDFCGEWSPKNKPSN